MKYNLNDSNLDYRYARDLSVDDSDFEAVVDAEGPYNEDGTMGELDMFKLEFSGWKSWVEFKSRM